MLKTSSVPKQIPPDTFRQHNKDKFQRTVQLTQKAIAKLETDGQVVTLVAVCETTRGFDKQGKGLRPITILRNPDATALFRQHSPAYQARLQKAKTARRKYQNSKVTQDARATYKGLRSSDLIQIIEDQRKQIAELKNQQVKLQSERDEAYRLRDETLQQNTRQLVALTQLRAKSDHRRRK